MKTLAAISLLLAFSSVICFPSGKPDEDASHEADVEIDRMPMMGTYRRVMAELRQQQLEKMSENAEGSVVGKSSKTKGEGETSQAKVQDEETSYEADVEIDRRPMVGSYRRNVDELRKELLEMLAENTDDSGTAGQPSQVEDDAEKEAKPRVLVNYLRRHLSTDSIDSDKLSEKGGPTITNMTEEDKDITHELLFPGVPQRSPRQERSSSESTDYERMYGDDFNKPVQFTDDEADESAEKKSKSTSKESNDLNRVPSLSSLDSDRFSEKGGPTITNMTEEDKDITHELLFPGAPQRPPREEDDDVSSQSTDYNELYGNDYDKQVRFTDDEDESIAEKYTRWTEELLSGDAEKNSKSSEPTAESEEMDTDELEAAARKIGLDSLIKELKEGKTPDIPAEGDDAAKLRAKVLKELLKFKSDAIQWLEVLQKHA